MQKRILALLLAGLLTASMASCVVRGTQNETTGPDEDPGYQTTTKPNEEETSPTITWTEVDKTIYALSDIKLRREASSVGATICTIPKEAELHCTLTSAAYSYVEYNGQQGYVLNSYVTDTDITGKTFTPMEGGSKIMFVNVDKANIRLYPSDSDFSTVMGGYELNDEVTVLATNGTWHQIKFVDKSNNEKKYYVSASLLSDSKTVSPDDLTQYEGLFSDVAGTPVMYVNGETVNFRKAPSKSATIIAELTLGTEVTVLQKGKVGESEWFYVELKIVSDQPGVPTTYQEGYISADCLSPYAGDLTLDELVALYGFEKINETMYILAEKQVNLRSAPVFPDTANGDKDNLVTTLSSGKTDIKALKIVAKGSYEGYNWCIVEHTMKVDNEDKTVYSFIGGKGLDSLTSDASGKITVSLNDLLVKYPQFTICETQTTITTKSVANCYGTPDTTGTALKQLASGTTVTLVAEETGSRNNVWYVIKDADNAYYFVGMEFFA